MCNVLSYWSILFCRSRCHHLRCYLSYLMTVCKEKKTKHKRSRDFMTQIALIQSLFFQPDKCNVSNQYINIKLINVYFLCD